MKKTIVTIIALMLLSPCSFALEKINITPDEQQLIDKCQLSFVTIAYYKTMKKIALYEDWRKSYDLAIRLNDLAMDAQHILFMHNDANYCERVKKRAERDPVYAADENTALQGRNSKDDFKNLSLFSVA